MSEEELSVDHVRDALENIVEVLVDVPSKIKVSATETDDMVIFTVIVDPSDYGKVIGSQGRTADAIRVIMTGACGKLKKRAYVEIPTKPRESHDRSSD